MIRIEVIRPAPANLSNPAALRRHEKLFLDRRGFPIDHASKGIVGIPRPVGDKHDLVPLTNASDFLPAVVQLLKQASLARLLLKQEVS